MHISTWQLKSMFLPKWTRSKTFCCSGRTATLWLWVGIQNTIEEINQDFIHANDVQVVRRLTGGGAVYHDLGNLNYSFIVNSQDTGFSFRVLSQPVIDTLQKLGVEAEFSGRNDLTIDGKKISGNAQFRRAGRLLHHGTLLFNSNLDTIHQALAVKGDKIESKGIKSVRSRVTNIHDYLPGVTIDQFISLLKETLAANALVPYQFSQADRDEILRLRETKYATWDWNYGQSPEYDIKKERRFSEGGLSLFLCVNHGVIRSVRILGDFFGNGDIHELEDCLKDVPIREDSLLAALQNLDLDNYIHGLGKEEFAAFLAS